MTDGNWWGSSPVQTQSASERRMNGCFLGLYIPHTHKATQCLVLMQCAALFKSCAADHMAYKRKKRLQITWPALCSSSNVPIESSPQHTHAHTHTQACTHTHTHTHTHHPLHFSRWPITSELRGDSWGYQLCLHQKIVIFLFPKKSPNLIVILCLTAPL